MGSRQQLAAERSAAGQTIAWIRLAGRAGGAAAAITAAGLLFWTLVPLTVGWRPEVVLSGSMAPHVAPGDVVLVASTNHAVRPGQVILFVDPARPYRRLLHRVVSRNPDGTYVTRGDANPSADSTPVPPGNVQGMARLRVPWIGLLVYWARQRAWTSLVAVAVVLGAGTVLTRPAQPVGRHRYRPARQDGVRA